MPMTTPLPHAPDGADNRSSAGSSALLRDGEGLIADVDEIAFQTDLLALSVVLEAARAGEQGRDFAFAAAEMRILAQRGAAAARAIQAPGTDTLAQEAAGSRLVRASETALQGLSAAVKSVSDISAEIAAVWRKQSAAIEQVSRAHARLDQVAQQAAASAAASVDGPARASTGPTSFLVPGEGGRATSGARQREERRGPGRPWSGSAAVTGGAAELRARHTLAPAPACAQAAGDGGLDDC